MGHCSLGKSVHLSSVVGWGTVAWAEGDTYMRVDGGTLYPGVQCPPLPHVNSDSVHRDEIGEIVSLEGLLETSNNQALLNLFIIT